MHTVLDHPLVRHRVTLMRDINTKPKQFRNLVHELAELLRLCVDVAHERDAMPDERMIKDGVHFERLKS